MIQQLQPRENGNKIIRLFSISIAFSLIDIPVVLAVEYDLEYDANGNLIQGKDKYFEYNNFNQLFRVREDNQNGNILEEYFYDHEGNRVLKKVYESGQVTQEIYYIDRNFVQIINSTGTFNEVYYYDDSGLIAENGTDSGLKAYHSDHLGSTSLITNETGNVTELTEYEPYGSVIEGGNSRFTYTGKEKDATGLMYYGARNYNPEQGQFIEPDKELPEIYDPQQLNRYAYARNNPYKYVDKDGEKAIYFGIVGSAGYGYGKSSASGYMLAYSLEGMSFGKYERSGEGIVSPTASFTLEFGEAPNIKHVLEFSETTYDIGGDIEIPEIPVSAGIGLSAPKEDWSKFAIEGTLGPDINLIPGASIYGIKSGTIVNTKYEISFKSELNKIKETKNKIYKESMGKLKESIKSVYKKITESKDSSNDEEKKRKW